MALDDDIRVLSGVDLFSDLSAEQLRLMAFGAEALRFSAGQQIYAEGAAADCAYVIVGGTVVLYREKDGEAIAVARPGPGAILGQMALIAPTTRLTHAAAETDTVLIRLNRTLFRRILEEYPETAMELHRRMKEDLHAFLKKIERVAPRFLD